MGRDPDLEALAFARLHPPGIPPSVGRPRPCLYRCSIRLHPLAMTSLCFVANPAQGAHQEVPLPNTDTGGELPLGRPEVSALTGIDWFDQALGPP
jgi:hypothetical protein